MLYKNVWIPNLPPHKTVFEKREVCGQLLDKGGWLIRNHYDFDCQEKTCFWFVIKDTFGGLEELSGNTRHKVRKSLRTYDIRKVSKEDILEWGLPIFQSAQKKYKVKTVVFDKRMFEKRILSCNDNTDFWGVFEKNSGTPVALSINTVGGDYCEYNTLKADPKYLNSTYPYYGLFYEMNRYYLQECRKKYVNDGARSITEHSNVQTFLIEKFLFRKAYCRLQIEYKWWFKILVYFFYPFRKFMPVNSVKAILNQEAMRRNRY